MEVEKDQKRSFIFSYSSDMKTVMVIITNTSS